MKRRTLKDIEELKLPVGVVFIRLRQEAIKRAKHFQYLMIDKPNKKTNNYWRGRRDEAMESNNLTDEDLK